MHIYTFVREKWQLVPANRIGIEENDTNCDVAIRIT